MVQKKIWYGRLQEFSPADESYMDMWTSWELVNKPKQFWTSLMEAPGVQFNRHLKFKAWVKAWVKDEVKDAFRKALDREMVKAWVKSWVKAVQNVY